MSTSSTKRATRAPRVCVFDSGVGGLTILSAMKKSLPDVTWIYCCDNKNFPYGPKSADEVVHHVTRAAAALMARYVPDLFVIACNTASTIALPRLRINLKIPVVGVVPAIKPAAATTKTGTIGLLATPGTVARPYTKQLIHDFASGRRVLMTGTSDLVWIAEAKAQGLGVDMSIVSNVLRDLFSQSPTSEAERLDAVVLGCTHFPLIVGELSASAPWPVTWIDSGPAVAARVGSLLAATDLRGSPGPGTAVVTKLDSHALRLAKIFESCGLVRLESL
jgi:glutamate racemase